MKKIFTIALLTLLVIAVFPASAAHAPSVTVSDQIIVGHNIVIENAAATGPAWVAIHADDNGSFGPVIGTAHVPQGQISNFNVFIQDISSMTPVLYAMLHEDTGEVGVYEFGTVDGADMPVMQDDAPVAPAFNVEVLHAHAQFVDGSVSLDAVVDSPAIAVIHDETDGTFGGILGAIFIEAGTHAGVEVPVEGMVTSRVWPMLHEDNGVVGEYEGLEIDPPIVLNGKVATGPINTVESVGMGSQIAVHGDNYAGMMMDDMGTAVTATYVLSDGPGIFVIHADNEGAPGDILGATFVEDGYNSNVEVALEGMITSTVWAMLHDDNGVVGEYEGLEIDGPTMVDGNVVTFPVAVAPSMTFSTQSVSENGTITIANALIDDHGWVAVHASVDGAPGPVIGTAPLNIGSNSNVVVALDFSMVENAATDQVFPMMHYDNNVIGTYEFGDVEGADGPVMFNESVIVAPLTLE